MKKSKPDISVQSHKSIHEFQQWLKTSGSKLAQVLRALRKTTPDKVREELEKKQ